MQIAHLNAFPRGRLCIFDASPRRPFDLNSHKQRTSHINNRSPWTSHNVWSRIDNVWRKLRSTQSSLLNLGCIDVPWSNVAPHKLHHWPRTQTHTHAPFDPLWPWLLYTWLCRHLLYSVQNTHAYELENTNRISCDHYVCWFVCLFAVAHKRESVDNLPMTAMICQLDTLLTSLQFTPMSIWFSRLFTYSFQSKSALSSHESCACANHPHLLWPLRIINAITVELSAAQWRHRAIMHTLPLCKCIWPKSSFTK